MTEPLHQTTVPIDPASHPWLAGYRDAQQGIVGNEDDYSFEQRANYIDGWLTGDAEKDCTNG